MNNSIKPLKSTKLVFISPWLLATAVGLLLFIISIFAATNIHRGKTLLIQAKFQKGMDLIRFVGAGTRASTMSGTSISAHIQQLIEQSAADDEIVSISVINDKGMILAHNDPNLVGSTSDRGADLFWRTTPGGNYRITSSRTPDTRVLEVFHHFRPFRPRHGRMMGRGQGMRWQQMMRERQLKEKENPADYEWYKPPADDDSTIEGQNLIITVSLDMDELDKLVSQHKYNIFFISVVLLLVGLGGWLSLMTAQGYKVSQKTLEHMQAFTSLIVSKLPDGIIATDSENRIISFNETMTTITGITSGEVVGNSAMKNLPPEFIFFFDIEEKKELLDQEIQFAGNRGEKYCLLISSVPITNNDGQFTGRVLLIHDITRLKKLENEISRNERFIALGKMAAGVAHEVRNPLSSIKGFATLMGSKFPEESNEYQTARLMIKESERLNKSISALLNYARPAVLDLEKSNVLEIVKDSVKLVEADAEESGVTISIKNDLADPLVKADPDRIKQILLNLILNSLQAMEEGGTISIYLGQGANKDEYELVVEDTGCGIEEDDLERVTDPYFTKRKNGTGLGLAMALKNIEEHGGHLDIQSIVGSGTKITICLPIAGP